MTPEQNDTPALRVPHNTPEARKGMPVLMPPIRLIRIASVAHRVLEEIRAAPLDDLGRDRAVALLRSCVTELRHSLEPAAREELLRLLVDMDGAGASDATLRVAQATVVGWLDGLLQGFQAMWSTQFMSNMRPGDGGPVPRPFGEPHEALAGRYL